MTETVPPQEGIDYDKLIAKISRRVGMRYRAWVGVEDLSQELYAFRLDNPIYDFATYSDAHRLLSTVAIKYAEAEKAYQKGYSVDDLMHYSENLVAELLDIALDSEWDGMVSGADGLGTAQSDDLLALVMDVRRAVPVVGTGIVAIAKYLNDGPAPHSDVNFHVLRPVPPPEAG